MAPFLCLGQTGELATFCSLTDGGLGVIDGPLLRVGLANRRHLRGKGRFRLQNKRAEGNDLAGVNVDPFILTAFV